jgi:hypothetical protein
VHASPRWQPPSPVAAPFPVPTAEPLPALWLRVGRPVVTPCGYALWLRVGEDLEWHEHGLVLRLAWLLGDPPGMVLLLLALLL